MSAIMRIAEDAGRKLRGEIVGNKEEERRIEELREKISELRTKLNAGMNTADEQNIEQLENVKKHLQNVKDTILYLKETGRLVAVSGSESLDMIKLRTGKKATIDLEENSEPLGKNPALILVMGLSCVMAYLLLGSWIQIGGYEIDFLKLVQIAQRVEDIFNTSREMERIIAFLWFICIMQWGFAAAYIWNIWKLYRNRKSTMIFSAMFGVFFIFLVLLIVTTLVNSGIDEIYGGLSDYVSAQMTGKALTAVVLACLCGVIYAKSKQINQNIFGIDCGRETVVTKTLPIINYYPWEDIKFTDIVLGSGRSDTLALAYRLPFWKERGYREQWEKSIEVQADVLIKANRKKFALYSQTYYLDWNISKGCTNRITLEKLPFEINEIEEVKVVIRGIEMPDGAKSQEYRVYAMSNLTYDKLIKHRQQIGAEEDICKPVTMEKGWMCRCGLVHYGEDAICISCGTMRREIESFGIISGGRRRW